MEPRIRDLIYYVDELGREPARDWIRFLQDTGGKARTYIRIKRAQLGNFGDYKSVGDGVIELRISCGPGYRVYFSLDESRNILLVLNAGNKSTQFRDILKAKKYWKEYKNAQRY